MKFAIRVGLKPSDATKIEPTWLLMSLASLSTFLIILTGKV